MTGTLTVTPGHTRTLQVDPGAGGYNAGGGCAGVFSGATPLLDLAPPALQPGELHFGPALFGFRLHTSA